MCASAHYLVSVLGGSLTGGKSITILGRITVTGHPVFHWQTQPSNTGTAPASFRLFFQRQGDNLSSDFYRWWSNPLHVELRPGAFRLTVPLAYGQWSSVFGHRADSSAAAKRGFSAALAHPWRVGMTFGGGNSFGHGVNIRGGTATMRVTYFHMDR